MTKVGTFFDINKSTTNNHIKFKRLPRQSSLKSTLKRFLNHSNNRYLEQKIYQKTTTNNLSEVFRNKFIFHIIINYLKLLLYSPSLIGHQLSKLAESKEGKAMNKDTWRLLLKKTSLFTQKVSIVFWTNERFTINLFSYVKKTCNYIDNVHYVPEINLIS